MMTTSHKPGSRATPALEDSPGGPEPVDSAKNKPSITAAQRWLMISRKVQARVQQRGFVGGDPFEDFAQALEEVDDEYDTDVQGLLSLTDPTELVDQFRSLFAGYGLGKRDLDRLLDLNRDALERLAAANRKLIKGGVGGPPARGAALLRNATRDAIQTLQSLAQGATRIEQQFHLPTRPTRTFSNLLSRLAALADSPGEHGDEVEQRPARKLQAMEIHGAVVRAYDGCTASELAQAPVAALKGISRENGARLKRAFGIESIRAMAESRLAERADGIVTLADQEDSGSQADAGSLRDIADGPVARLEGISARQAGVLRDSLHIKTVRDLAENRLFRVARAIVALADSETE